MLMNLGISSSFRLHVLKEKKRRVNVIAVHRIQFDHFLQFEDVTHLYGVFNGANVVLEDDAR